MVIERPKSLRDLVLENLRDRIVSGRLAMGQSLSERSISDELQVSKTPVREALAQLREEGLVQIEPQKGAKVFTLTEDEVEQICDFRMTIEFAAFELAMARSHEGLLTDMSDIVASMTKAMDAGEIQTYLDLDTAFHRLAFKHCGNEYLSASYERYEGKIAALRTHMAALPLHTKLSYEEHFELKDACNGNDLPELRSILERHIARTRDSYVQATSE
ncbi:GntR family transcriptional regulator [Roseibium sp. MMSF_3544]|uniref:GntR family transcriptional regulator n=1 Tax=unclassified Roseibium TaxID=2629323 RepID=UPI00273F0AAF|nr:GntR family transcriptional regulator [Roseibium sp. MMSF_3544]